MGAQKRFNLFPSSFISMMLRACPFCVGSWALTSKIILAWQQERWDAWFLHLPGNAFSQRVPFRFSTDSADISCGYTFFYCSYYFYAPWEDEDRTSLMQLQFYDHLCKALWWFRSSLSIWFWCTRVCRDDCYYYGHANTTAQFWKVSLAQLSIAFPGNFQFLSPPLFPLRD